LVLMSIYGVTDINNLWVIAVTLWVQNVSLWCNAQRM